MKASVEQALLARAFLWSLRLEKFNKRLDKKREIFPLLDSRARFALANS